MLVFSRQTIGAFFTACLCIFGVSLLQFPHMQQLISTHKTTPLETLERQIKKEKFRLNLLKKMPSFGYTNLVANWVYLDFYNTLVMMKFVRKQVTVLAQNILK